MTKLWTYSLDYHLFKMVFHAILVITPFSVYTFIMSNYSNRESQAQKILLCLAMILGFVLIPPQSLAQTQGQAEVNRNNIAGQWIFNQDLSDNTDKQVERALRAAGEKVSRSWFRTTTDKYRGGPPEQELYDHLSYDTGLSISLNEPEYKFTYDDGFLRSVYTDNRSQSVSLNAIEEVQDFSFAHWNNEFLEVEARPRDGGFAQESYRLINDGSQLSVELYILPKVFQKPIEITRIYDRLLE